MVNLHRLNSDDSKESNGVVKSKGKTISKVEITDNVLVISFTDDTTLSIRDDGQTCCESRYMVTDDDLPYYAGATLLSVEISDAPNQEDEYGDHEVQFLRVNTNKGTFVLSNHNEHNGHYSGFAMIAY